ncbi:NAD(P)/FAD-dependent oxidoreductase [Seohaeicola zhoushanensis]|uniref:FAD-dependent oxidoreductase n=1 Tax=Seohaeicola zhoushanensis TaxID=1569283 RepID=A0A8J3GZT5_9RHOB|nr:FAD-binding oxidoreductase [Seohaeicola zhoushanensis]GHF57001.1 FAD-dependent oxidoreductase [Seohaeicola zhoushanensis]
MIANEIPVIADSLWSATANPAPDCPPLVTETDADVVVIGGGYTGLSAALRLAEAGRSVALLEAESPGWGASGRNGGQVNPGLKEDPEAIEARFGAEMGARMVRASGEAGQAVFDLIDRLGIRCDPVRAGWIRAAHNGRALEALRETARQWQARGAPLRMLDREEIAAMIGTGVYCGGLIDPRGGNLHPLNYALGLAMAAQAAGARIHGQSRVRAVTREGGGYRVSTVRGIVRARRVLVCTNGYTGDLIPGLAQSVVPVRSVQVATAPLGDNVLRSVLPGRQAPSDTRRLLLYYRLDAQGRFIMGGRGAYDEAGTRRQFQALRRATETMFPQLGPVTWAHAWGGFVAMTLDHYPHLNRVGDGILAGLGYNGRGVATATVMGRVMADWALGRPEEALDFPVTPLRPIPMHGLRRLGVRAALLKNQLLDGLGL